jgi:hypothetical protein
MKDQKAQCYKDEEVLLAMFWQGMKGPIILTEEIETHSIAKRG